MRVTGMTGDMIATSALQQASASTEAVEQAESAGLIATKNDLAANQKLQAKLDSDLAETSKTARRKKKFMRFRKNRKIKKAQKREAVQEHALKKTKGAGERLLKEADSTLARIEKGNDVSQQLQKVMNQIQNKPIVNSEGSE